MHGFAYFPAIVYRDERQDLAQQVSSVCVEYLDRVRQPGLQMTQSDHMAFDSRMESVCKYLIESSVGILKDQGYAVDRYDFYLSGLWAQEVLSGGGTNVHVHKNSQVCGWMFIDAPENGAYPIYHDVRMNKGMIELDAVQTNDVTTATNMIYFNNMKPGTVMFSNSWMQHQLANGGSLRPTRCLHFIVSHRDR